nr:molybdenum cofactor guanylyltransferase [Sphingobium subterraneum]
MGAIIAGGAARRFGSDKAAALLRGVPLMDHVARALAPQVPEIVVVGRQWAGMTCVPDRPQAGEGPLGGLCGALHYAQSKGYGAVLTVGCDTLPVPTDLLKGLGEGPAVVATQWLFGLWPASLAATLEAWLAEQPDRSIKGWMQHTGARRVECDARFVNINTPEGLAEAALQLDPELP